MTLSENAYHGVEEIVVGVGVLFAQAPQFLLSDVQERGMEGRKRECQTHRVMLPRMLMLFPSSYRFFALCLAVCA